MAYDYEKCVKILIKRDGMSDEGAREFMEFNVVDAYVGELTPAFIDSYIPEDIEEDLKR